MDVLAWYLLGYIALLFTITFIVSRKQSKEDFLISGRDRDTWQIFNSKFAQSIGAGFFITYTGFAYQFGLGVFSLLVGFAAGFVFFGLWAAPRIRALSNKHKFYTIGDLAAHAIPLRITKLYANVVSSAILFTWLLVGVVGGAKIISDFELLSYELAVVVTALVMLVYLLIAGHKAVLITDVVQSIIILALLLVVTVGMTSDWQWAAVLTTHSPVSLSSTLGFFLYGLLAIFSSAHLYQLCYAAKNKQAASRGIVAAVIPIVVTCALLLVIGVFMSTQTTGLDTGLVFTEALKGFLPAWLVPAGIVLFFAGVMSSADTGIYAIASHLVPQKKELSTRHIRLATIATTVIVAVLSLFFRDIVQVSIVAAGASLLLSVPLIYVVAGGKNPRKFFSSAIASLVGFGVGILMFGLVPEVILPLLALGSLGLLVK